MVKFAAGVVDTGGKFATGVVDTGGNFAAGVVVVVVVPLSLRQDCVDLTVVTRKN